MSMEQLEKTLPNGTRVVLIRKPGFSRSLFLAGFGTGGLFLQERQKDGTIRKARSGSAHFLEHQMFRLNGQDVSDDMAAMQASANAYTAYDETAYYFQTTADPLPPLALLLDFVQTLDITEASVNKEKGIILSEYDMYDQNPDARLIQETMKSLYRHYPLNTDILGTPEDIQDMSVQDLRTFYETWYDPARMIVVGVTHLPLEPVMTFIEEHERAYPGHPERDSRPCFEPEPETVVRKTHTLEMDVLEPYVCVGFKMRPEGDVRQSLRRDLAVSFWIDGLFSPLNPEFQGWIDRRILAQVYGAEGDFTPDHAYLLFYAQTDKAQEFIQLVQDIITRRPELPEATFEILKRQNLARSLRLQDSFQGLAQKQLRGSLDGITLEEMTDMARQITLEDMCRTVAGLDFENCTITTILPSKSGGQR